MAAPAVRNTTHFGSHGRGGHATGNERSGFHRQTVSDGIAMPQQPQHNLASSLAALLQSTDADGPIGLIIVDHGSVRQESNDLLLQVVESFRRQTGAAIVEPAHMELAEPSIATAFGRAVGAGAKRVIVAPFFLAPGKHWNEDIPNLTRAASEANGATPFQIAEPIGSHPAMAEVLASRIADCMPRPR